MLEWPAGLGWLWPACLWSSCGGRTRLPVRRIEFASCPKEIAGLFQDFSRVDIFFADDAERVIIEEPPEAAVFARFDLYFGFVGFCEKEDDGVVDALVADLKIEPFVGAEIRDNAELGFLNAGLFFEFAEGRIDAALAGLEMALGEVPVIPAAIEEQKFYAVGRAPIDDKTSNHLLFGG